jgi:hypothetical protein
VGIKSRLDAIGFNDIVGYAALKDTDKDMSFMALRKNREI